MENMYVVSLNILNALQQREDMKELMNTIKNYDLRTYTHSINVAKTACLVALHYHIQKRIEKQEVVDITQGAMLHDIGKVVIPQKIINKPDRLSLNEYDIIKQHPLVGYQYCKKFYVLPDTVCRIILEHHERIDGSGYPKALDATRLCLGSKIVMVCDSIDAIMQERSYKSAISKIEAIRKIKEESMTQYDAEVLNIIFSQKSSVREKENFYEL